MEEWKCPNCPWSEKAHPTYGWQSHNDRAVEVHKTQLCPALSFEDDFTTPEGYDDSPDQGVHRYDGGGFW